MHGVNLDLLRAASTRHGGAHAYHLADHLADLRAARDQRWRDRFARLRALVARRPAPTAQACPERLS